MGGATESAGTYWKTDEKKVMIRAFDFTVQRRQQLSLSRHASWSSTRTTSREDVSPGVDTKTETDARAVERADRRSSHAAGRHAVRHRQRAADPQRRHEGQVPGHPVPPGGRRDRDQELPDGPGEVIGEPGTAVIPSSDGTKPRPARSTSTAVRSCSISSPTRRRRGYQFLPTGFVGPPIERPVITLLLRPDGSVAVHTEADDVVNEVRRDIDANYKHEMKESARSEKQHRHGHDGMGMGGMMGGMGGMRGGGMGGMR